MIPQFYADARRAFPLTLPTARLQPSWQRGLREAAAREHAIRGCPADASQKSFFPPGGGSRYQSADAD
jgi:hypothetical protein